MAFSEFVTTVTQDQIFPKVIDNVMTGRVLLERFLGAAKPWGSGTPKKIPIKWRKSTSGGSYDLWDTFTTSQSTERVLATYYLKYNYWSVVVANPQIAVNQGDAQVIDLVRAEMDSKTDDMRDALSTQLYGDGTGNSSKDIEGLGKIVLSSGTYAGLAPGTYTTWVSDEDSDTEPITLADLRQSIDDATIGSDAPTLIVTTKAVWKTLEGLLMATINYHTQVQGYPRMTRFGIKPAGTGQTADIGFDVIYVRGIPTVKDEACTTGFIYVLNERHLWFGTRQHPEYATKNGFAWTGWKTPTNQDAKVGQFLLYGNMLCDSRRTQAYLHVKS